MKAKEELIKHIESVGANVKWIYIDYKGNFYKGTLKDILPLMDFEYNEGFGNQYLFGYIWYSNGTWSEREEYDGSEWWVHKECPDIEEYL